MTATLRSSRRKENKDDADRDVKCLLIVLYGSRVDSDNIGDILAESNLYLQHPHGHDPTVDYVNPQYLLRPGSCMKILGDHSVNLLKSVVAKDDLEDTLKSRVLKVFDDSDGPRIYAEVKPSARLRTPLKS
jgi:hypothetical protein